jgi:hypothetical protein
MIMQIILEQKLVPELREKYTILELDTVMQPGMAEPLTLYALIEHIDFNTISKLSSLTEQHEIMVRAYKSNDFDTAEQGANILHGSWRGELNEFYELVISTCKEMINTNTTWTGVRYTEPKEDFE